MLISLLYTDKMLSVILHQDNFKDPSIHQSARWLVSGG